MAEGNAPGLGSQDLTEPERDGAPLGGTRGEAMQRLQVGLSGLAAMILLVGLASVIQSGAQRSDETAVPEAAPTTEPTEAPQQTDPLADAGVVPDIPAEPEPTPTQEPALIPEQGEGPGATTEDVPTP